MPPEYLVGREAERAELIALLTDASSDQVGLIELAGPAGIGKTTLVEWFRDQASRRGFATLTASAFRQESHHPYGVLGSLLTPAFEDSELAPTLDRVDLDLLASVIPAVRRHLPDFALSESVEQVELFAAVHAAFTGVASDSRGLLIVIDNSEWIDPASLNALGFVCRRGVGVPLVIATTRRTPSDDQLLPLSAVPIGELRLGPLSELELSDIVGDLSDADKDAVVREAEGNPFYAIELAEHRRRTAGPVAAQRLPGTDAIPASVRTAVLDEVLTFSRSAQSLLQAGAVLGDGFDIRIAIQLAELSTDRGFDAADELIAASVLVPLPLRTVRYRHPLLPAVIHDSLPPARRVYLHQQAAQLLGGTGNDPIATAWHWAATASVGDADAIEQIAKGAHASCGVAPDTTISLAESALSLIPDHGPLTAQRPHLVAYLADGLIRNGRLDDAELLVKSALVSLPPDDKSAIAVLTIMLFRVLRWRGDNVDLRGDIDATMRHVPADQHFERAMLGCIATIEAARAADVPTMRALVVEAQGEAESSDEPTAKLSVAIMSAMAETTAGDPLRAVPRVEEAEQLLALLPTEQVAIVIDTVAVLASVEEWLGRSEQALACASHGRGDEFHVGGDRAKFWFTTSAAMALASLGRLESADETAEIADVLARALRAVDLIATAVAMRASIAALKGDRATTRRFTQEFPSWFSRVSDSQLRMTAAVTVLPAYVMLGDVDEATHWVTDTTLDPSLPEVPKPMRSGVFENLMLAELQLGNVEAARLWANRGSDVAADVGFPISETSAARSRAAMSAAQGNVAEAISAAAQAVSAGHQCGHPMQAARSLLLQGELQMAAGSASEAIESLTEAARIYTTCGAPGPLAQCRHLLRELGVMSSGRRGGERTGIESLSGREREVAELITAGLTNPQIAEQLYLSVRTVESHVSRIFGKLDVSNRADVASVVRQVIDLG